MKTLLKNFIAVLVVSILFLGNIWAVPAFSKLQIHRQSNGNTVSYYAIGDEFLHCAKSVDRYTLLSDEKGDMYYAVLDGQGNMVRSDILASDPEQRGKEEIEFLSSLDRNLFFSDAQVKKANERRNFRDKDLKAYRESQREINENPNLLVVLVNFTNKTLNSSNISTFKHQICDTDYTANNATGSVRDYFFDNSFEQMDPKFHVIGPYTIPHANTYYGANEEDVPQMVLEAISIADTTDDIDFSIFDNDGDGVIDLVHVIYAGQGEHYTQQTNLIWAHMYYVEDTTTFDGVRLWRYSCSSEISQFGGTSPDGIGAVCHEMGHVFGLPDFYDTDYTGSGGEAATTGTFDVMAEGSYNGYNCMTPPYYSMVERQMIGWAEPQIIDHNGEYTLEPLIESNSAYTFDLDEDEYLTLEYRKKVKWDTEIPAEGMLAFHAVRSKFENWEETNDINANPNDRGFFIEPASGGETNNSTAAVSYPGSANVTTKEGSTLRNGTTVDYTLYDIHYDESNNIIFNYGENKIKYTLSAEDITSNSATLTGEMQSDYDISDRVLQYRQRGTVTYTDIVLNANTFSEPVINLQPSTTYEYRVYATADDTVYYSSLNTFTTLCDGNAITSFPYSEGFEAGLGCWTSEVVSNNGHWESAQSVSSYYSSISPAEGSYMAHFESGSTGWNSSSARLISPEFDFSSYEQAYVTFKYNIMSYANNPFRLYYRTSPTSSWVQAKSYSTSYTNMGTWRTDSVNLPNISSESQIAFLAVDSYGSGVFVDDLTVGVVSSSSVNDIEGNNNFISLYPNPTCGDAVLKLAEVNKTTKVSLCDISGREIYSITPAQTENTVVLPCSNLEKGVYFVKVINKGAVSTCKLVKD
ncbi:MAG: M6 family metalloprotease domain-containing protein [Bacteroidales bacterium]|nr:M6 family metalloprotease domain-containing protein [Bacteroidales bacterium]